VAAPLPSARRCWQVLGTLAVQAEQDGDLHAAAVFTRFAQALVSAHCAAGGSERVRLLGVRLPGGD
jgi:hypothetical protein